MSAAIIWAQELSECVLEKPLWIHKIISVWTPRTCIANLNMGTTRIIFYKFYHQGLLTTFARNSYIYKQSLNMIATLEHLSVIPLL